MHIKIFSESKLVNIICILLIVGTISYVVLSGRFLAPLKLEVIPEKEFSYSMEDVIYIEEDEHLDKTCYKGSVDWNIPNRKTIHGLLNYLCSTYKVKDIKISTKNARLLNEDSMTLADSNIYGISFYENSITLFNPSKEDLAHIVFHEYIHLLMFRNMANGYTINYKSKKLIDSVKNSYLNLPEDILFPSEYSKSSSKEQIAEILGWYLAKKVKFDYQEGQVVMVGTSNFEQDLFSQFVLNIN